MAVEPSGPVIGVKEWLVQSHIDPDQTVHGLDGNEVYLADVLAGFARYPSAVTGVDSINAMIARLPSAAEISDGHHTFKELYECRMALNAALFYFMDTGDWHDFFQAHKSWRHHDGEPCFGGGWFIVCAKLRSGIISFHYKAEHWDKFDVPAHERALFEYDGHTTQDVISRILYEFS